MLLRYICPNCHNETLVEPFAFDHATISYEHWRCRCGNCDFVSVVSLDKPKYVKEKIAEQNKPAFYKKYNFKPPFLN